MFGITELKPKKEVGAPLAGSNRMLLSSRASPATGTHLQQESTEDFSSWYQAIAFALQIISTCLPLLPRSPMALVSLILSLHYSL